MATTSLIRQACAGSRAVYAHRDLNIEQGGAHRCGVDEPRATVLTEVAVVAGISNLGGEGLAIKVLRSSPVEGLPGMGGPSGGGI